MFVLKLAGVPEPSPWFHHAACQQCLVSSYASQFIHPGRHLAATVDITPSLLPRHQTRAQLSLVLQSHFY